MMNYSGRILAHFMRTGTSQTTSVMTSLRWKAIGKLLINERRPAGIGQKIRQPE